MWLEGQDICPGVQAVSGPIALNAVPSSLALDLPQCSGILISQNGIPLSEIPIFSETFYTTVVIRSNKSKVSLPFNTNLGFVRSQTLDDEQVFNDAAHHTADQLASSWLQFAQSTLSNDSCFPSQPGQF